MDAVPFHSEMQAEFLYCEPLLPASAHFDILLEQVKDLRLAGHTFVSDWFLLAPRPVSAAVPVRHPVWGGPAAAVPAEFLRGRACIPVAAAARAVPVLLPANAGLYGESVVVGLRFVI